MAMSIFVPVLSTQSHRSCVGPSVPAKQTFCSKNSVNAAV